jgi:hypothetical protein
MNRENKVRMILNRIDSRMDVARGKIHVKPFP